MVVNAEKDGKAQLAKENDSRITPIGKIIRSMRIDELPQFFNILKGDMSVVGPRSGASGADREELYEDTGICLSYPCKGGAYRLCAGLRKIQYVFYR